MSFLKRLLGQKKEPAGSQSSRTSDLPSQLAPAKIAYFKNRLAFAQRSGDRRSEWEALGQIGDVYNGQGAMEQAVKYYELALKVALEARAQPWELGSRLNLSSAYEKMGRTQQAEESQDAALLIARKSKGAILSEYGIYLAKTEEEEDLKRAVKCFEMHLEIARKMDSRSGEMAALCNLGGAYRIQGYIHRAIECFEQVLEGAREIGDTDGEQAALGSLGTAYKEVGDLKRAAEYQEQALAMGRETGNESRLAINAFNLARLYAQLGDLAKALPLAQEAAEIWERMGDPDVKRAKKLVDQILSEQR